MGAAEQDVACDNGYVKDAPSCAFDGFYLSLTVMTKLYACSIQQAAVLAVGRLANHSGELAEAVVSNDILPQLVSDDRREGRLARPGSKLASLKLVSQEPCRFGRCCYCSCCWHVNCGLKTECSILMLKLPTSWMGCLAGSVHQFPKPILQEICRVLPESSITAFCMLGAIGGWMWGT